jgi:hypothetical protein
MSGGYFCGGDRTYFRMEQFADELEEEIRWNNMTDESGFLRGLEKETLDLLIEKLAAIRTLSSAMQAIDWYFSDDDGEEELKRKLKALPDPTLQTSNVNKVWPIEDEAGITWLNADGQCHRVDGPAWECKDGRTSWFINNVCLGVEARGFWALWDKLSPEERNNPNLLFWQARFGLRPQLGQ